MDQNLYRWLMVVACLVAFVLLFKIMRQQRETVEVLRQIHETVQAPSEE